MGREKTLIIEEEIRSFLAVEFLFWSACGLLAGEFPGEIAFSGRMIRTLQGVLLLLFLLTEAAEAAKGLWRMAALAATGIAGVGGLLLYSWNQRAHLIDGGLACYNAYIGYWNDYYKTNYGTVSCSGDGLMFTIALGILALMFVCMVCRRLTGVRGFLLLPSLCALSVGLCVNILPEWKGLSAFWIGGLLLYSSGCEPSKIRFHAVQKKKRRRYVSSVWFVLLFGVGLSFVVGKTCSSAAQQIPEHASVFINFQSNLEKNIQNLNKISLLKTKTAVDNSTPDFSGKEILTIRAAKSPTSNLYLARFYSSVYRQSEWEEEGNTFARAAEAAGYDVDALGEVLRQEVYEKTQRKENAAEESITYTINYQSLGIKDALVPYFTDVSGVKDLIWVEKEGLVRKKRSARTLSIDGLLSNSDGMSYWNLTDVATERTTVERDALNWYDSYVKEHNLTGSDEIPALEEYVRRVRLAMGGSTWYYANLSEEAIENVERMQIAGKVRDTLEQAAAYNLYLDAVPEGEDTIQYFLETGHEGYCMHFASAGALLLQELGVPARYASGYVVKESSFVWNGSEYEAKVLDRNGHAWVEIYLNGVGWVPYEMTPGYDSSEAQLPTNEENQEKLRKEYKKKVAAEEESEEKVTETGETQQASQAAVPRETQVTEIAVPSPVGESLKGTKNRRWRLWIAAVVLLIALLILAIGRRIQTSQLVKNAGFRQKHGRQAVAIMNRRMYQRIWDRVPKTDAQYLQQLIKSYPAVSAEEWEHFLAIVQKVSFSNEEIPPEEVEFCYKIYRSYR